MASVNCTGTEKLYICSLFNPNLKVWNTSRGSRPRKLNVRPVVTFSKLCYVYKIIEIGNLSGNSEVDLPLFEELGILVDGGIEILHENTLEGIIQVMVAPDRMEDFFEKVESKNLTSKVLVEDLDFLIRSNKIFRSDVQDLNGSVTLDRYMEFKEITDYLLGLPAKHPGIAKVKSIGKSIESQPILMVTLSDGKANLETKPIIFIEAGIHAREWISPAATLCAIENLINSPKLRENVEWRIVVVSNPDGYLHTWSSYRMWRKNRKIHGYYHCFGVDLNRNFDFLFGTKGISKNPCSFVYPGKKAFSEPESEALRNAVTRAHPRIKAYLSFHSYGQMILYPPGVDTDMVTMEARRLMGSVASKMSKRIQSKTGAKYTYGEPHQILYPASGISPDWAHLHQGIPLTFTIELRDKGKAGFILPASEIEPTCQDAWEAIKVLHDEVLLLKSTKVSTRFNVEPHHTRPNRVPLFNVSETSFRGIETPHFKENGSLGNGETVRTVDVRASIPPNDDNSLEDDEDSEEDDEDSEEDDE